MIGSGFPDNRSGFAGSGSVPVRRVLDKLDSCLAAKKYDEAERHLKYWLREAEASGDAAARLTVLNELMGFMRKQGRGDEAKEYAFNAVEYPGDEIGRDTVFYATTLLNAATVFKSFGEPERAITLYEQCFSVYKAQLDADDLRFAGLYNNMGLALADVGRFEEARNCYENAIRIQDGEGIATALDRAITYLNLCDLETEISDRSEDVTDGIDNTDKIDLFIEKAYGLISDQTVPRDAYYAFVCEKCAPVFGYYGFFLYKQQLEKEAEAINERYRTV